MHGNIKPWGLPQKVSSTQQPQKAECFQRGSGDSDRVSKWMEESAIVEDEFGALWNLMQNQPAFI